MPERFQPNNCEPGNINDLGKDRFDRIRVVVPSGTDNKEIAAARNVYRDAFRHHAEENFTLNSEVKKTPEELELVELLNSITNEILAEYESEPFNIPPENVHVIKSDQWPLPGWPPGQGSYSTRRQMIAIPRRRFLSEFAMTLAHEMLHFKSYFAEAKMEGSDQYIGYRFGLATRSIKDGSERLHWMNEGITEIMTTRLFYMISNYELFQKDRAGLEKAKPMLQGKIDVDELLAAETEPCVDGGIDIFVYPMPFNFLPEVRGMSLLIQTIYNKNETKFGSRSDVENMFIKAALGGNIVGIAKLVDSTFGRGTFIRLAESETADDLSLLVQEITGISLKK